MPEPCAATALTLMAPLREPPPLDAHYTPDVVAAQLLDRAGALPHGVIADFAVGGGDLLRQAARRWPERKIVACDIARTTVAAVSRDWASWEVGRCNFFSGRSRSASPLLREVKGTVALCLANPPFSYRGGRRWRVRTADGLVTCGPAIAFLLHAIEYLCSGGVLLAILPANALRSEKDRLAIDYISKKGAFEILEAYERGTFPGCTVRTVSVRFVCDLSGPSLLANRRPNAREKFEVSLTRGTTPVHTASTRAPGLVPLIHTTDLINNGVMEARLGVQHTPRLVHPPAVLIPRVGKPDSRKVAVYLDDTPSAISDCIIAINCRSTAEALHVLNAVVREWEKFALAYHGTCAPYLTIADLIQSLAGLGISARSASRAELRKRADTAACEVPAASSTSFRRGAGTDVLPARAIARLVRIPR